MLQNYNGTLFLVSHDRTFLDNVVTQTIVAEGDGNWREYVGGYSDWASYQATQQKEAGKLAKGASKPLTKAAEPVKLKGEKLPWKEQRELESLPEKVAALEAEQASLSMRLEDAAIYQANPQEAQKSAERLAAIDEELLLLLERWEVLEGKSGSSV